MNPFSGFLNTGSRCTQRENTKNTNGNQQFLTRIPEICTSVMIIYNITTNVSWAVHDSWIEWLVQTHIPGIITTGCFFEYRILRLLEVDDSDGPTYAIQFYASSESDYQRFVFSHSDLFSKEVFNKWGNEVVAFGSVMQLLH